MDAEQPEIHAWHTRLKFPLFWTCQPTNFFLSLLPSMMPLRHTIQNWILFGPTFFWSGYFCSVSGKTCNFCLFQVRVVCGSLYLTVFFTALLSTSCCVFTTLNGHFWAPTTVLMNFISWVSSLSLSLKSKRVGYLLFCVTFNWLFGAWGGVVFKALRY
jgi:hypothetical protein